jgi:hypothetical protein
MALLGEALLPMLPALIEARVRITGVEGDTLVLAVRGPQTELNLEPYLEQIVERGRSFGLELSNVRIVHEGGATKRSRTVDRAMKKLADPRTAPRAEDPLHHMPFVLSHAAEVHQANQDLLSGFPDLMRANVCVGEIDGNVLVLLVTGSAWASRVRLSQGDFLTRARQLGLAVDTVRVRVSPSMAKAPEPPPPPRQEPTARAREMMAQIQALLAQPPTQEPERDPTKDRQHAQELAQLEAELKARRAPQSAPPPDDGADAATPGPTPRRKRPRRRGMK